METTVADATPTMPTRLRVGTSGFGYREWLGKFYPPGLPARQMLSYYAERFAAVEINATFYRLPAPAMLESWAGQVPADFIFSFKAPGQITHRKRLRHIGEEAAVFATRIALLGPQLGPLLYLLPANLSCDLPLLGDFLQSIPRLRTAVEFRHPSWFSDPVFALLRDFDCALCLSDRDEAPPPPVIATTDFGYARLRRSDYTDGQLKEWKQRLTAQGWGEVFVFFRHEETAIGPQFARAFLEGGEGER